MIRKAKEQDIKQIYELGKELNQNFTSLYNLEKMLQESYTKIFVAVIAGSVVGFLHITELYETADIVNIIVDKDYRRQKIAILLMDYMLSDLGEKVKLITLEVAVDNLVAKKLYENFGFEVINKRLSYYENKDAYLMGKKLR